MHRRHTALVATLLVFGGGPLSVTHGKRLRMELESELASPGVSMKRPASATSSSDRSRTPRGRRGGPSCLDGSGHLADHFYAFKYPGDWSYAYMSEDVRLDVADDTLDERTSPVSRTLDQMYTQYKTLSYAVWNDEPVDAAKVEGPKAHSKGVFAFGRKQGFLLTHSLPKFPVAPGRPRSSASSYTHGNVSHKYGQSWLCITIDEKSLPILKSMYAVDDLVVYAAKDNAGLGDVFTSWAVDEGEGENEEPPLHLEMHMLSADGSTFTMFGKSGSYEVDFYESMVAPFFQKDFITETWQNGPGFLKSYCTRGHNHVMNSIQVKFDDSDEGTWSESTDHAKWAVSTDGSVLCVGDLNRQEGQRGRGGGTICKADKGLGRQLLATVQDHEACKNAG